MINVTEALRRYQSDHVDVKVSDWRRVGGIIRHLEEFFGPRSLKDIGIPESRSYVKWRTIEGAKPGTIRRELGTLVAAANHARKWKLISADDLPVVELPAAPPGKERWLTKDELNQLLEYAKIKTRWRLYCFIHIAYVTAARATNICGLEWSQVDLKNNRIYLAKPEHFATKKRRPVVPITPTLVKVLKQLYKKTGHARYVLGNPIGINYAFRKASVALNMAGVTPHVIRHTRATHLLQEGKSPWVVASLLGDDLTTVMKVYGHHCPDFLAEAISGSGDLPNPSPLLASL